ncbi:dihydrofolate reductase family protein [Amycolatopsis dendrobii]|uniref:dihydrofolate reductase family protein n=1 Tax=Amycolatopsis dendrobii TaxID=2760662 RepID=UPI001FE866F9|nr:dihydrofolate reductase family protein [Amycolatopsis dendrobii]
MGHGHRSARPGRGKRVLTRVSVTAFVTLGGVSQGPRSSPEDTSGEFSRGGWFVPHLDQAFVQRASEWLDAADGLLFDRRTYTSSARDWPAVTDPDDPFAERMSSLPKYAVSKTLETGTWAPTTVLRGDAAKAVRQLKAQPGRELQVHGSARLGNTLLSAGVVDKVRLVMTPTVLEGGAAAVPASGVGDWVAVGPARSHAS